MLDRMLRIETKAGEPLEQHGNGDLRLSAGKRRSQAEMPTAAKGEMARVRPLDIEAVRVGVPHWVQAVRKRLVARCRAGRGCLRFRSQKSGAFQPLWWLDGSRLSLSALRTVEPR